MHPQVCNSALYVQINIADLEKKTKHSSPSVDLITENQEYHSQQAFSAPRPARLSPTFLTPLVDLDLNLDVDEAPDVFIIETPIASTPIPDTTYSFQMEHTTDLPSLQARPPSTYQTPPTNQAIPGTVDLQNMLREMVQKYVSNSSP